MWDCYFLRNILALIFIVASAGAVAIVLYWQELKCGWAWCKRVWTSIRKILAGGLLLLAFGCICFAIWLFAPYFYKIYFVLSSQINTEYFDAVKQVEETGKQVGETVKQIEETGEGVGRKGIIDSYFSISIRYFGIVAAAGAIIGYVIAIARNIISDNQNKIADEQNKISERGQITENMVQAIDQIGTFNDKKPNIEVRLGGIYSLERIAQDSNRDYVKIMNILCAYVRETALKKSKNPIANVREDIQAAIDVLGTEIERVNQSENKETFRVNLENCNLSKYRFSERDFNRYNDINNGAIFDESLFKEAQFYKTDLSYASFDNSNLTKAYFEGANLKGARFEKANCRDAVFKDANVCGANLSKAKHLIQDQLNEMIGDEKTKIPARKNISRPQHWLTPI